MDTTPSAIWRAFVRDWVVFAPAVVWLSVLLSIVFGVGLWGAQLATGALLTYALALTWSYAEELDVQAWGGNRLGGLFVVIVPNVKHVTTGIATVLLTAILLRDALREKFSYKDSEPIMQFLSSANSAAVYVGYGLSATAIGVATIVIIKRTQSATI